MSDLIVTTEKNLMKRSDLSGHTTLNGPDQDFYFGVGFYSEYRVRHNLGYIPMFRVYYEPWGDGKVTMAFLDGDWEMNNPPNDFTATEKGPVCFAYADENELIITLMYTSDIGGQDFPIYWVIYEDYRLDEA